MLTPSPLALSPSRVLRGVWPHQIRGHLSSSSSSRGAPSPPPFSPVAGAPAVVASAMPSPPLLMAAPPPVRAPMRAAPAVPGGVRAGSGGGVGHAEALTAEVAALERRRAELLDAGLSGATAHLSVDELRSLWALRSRLEADVAALTRRRERLKRQASSGGAGGRPGAATEVPAEPRQRPPPNTAEEPRGPRRVVGASDIPRSAHARASMSGGSDGAAVGPSTTRGVDGAAAADATAVASRAVPPSRGDGDRGSGVGGGGGAVAGAGTGAAAAAAAVAPPPTASSEGTAGDAAVSRRRLLLASYAPKSFKGEGCTRE